MKSNSDIALGRNKVAPKLNPKFDSRDQSARRPFATREDFPSPSRLDKSSLPSQFDFLMSDSGYESDKVEVYNNPAYALQPPVITKFDQLNRTMAPKSSVITEFETCSTRKEFAPDRQRPIMSRESLITTPNYVPEFEHNGNYVSRSTTRHKPSVASSTDVKHVLSVRVTDKKCVCGYSQHCNCSTEPFTSCVNKDAVRKVPFPWSNFNLIINAQYPTGVRKFKFPSETAEEAQNSTRRILRQNWIEMHQSASRVSDQSATPPAANRSSEPARQPTNQRPPGPVLIPIKAAATSSSSSLLSQRQETTHLHQRLLQPIRL